MQGLSERPFMDDVEHWGVLTIGTGLGFSGGTLSVTGSYQPLDATLTALAACPSIEACVALLRTARRHADAFGAIVRVHSFQGLLLAQVITNLPFFLQPLVASLGGVDRKLLEVARTLGSGPTGTYFRVALPLAWRLN